MKALKLGGVLFVGFLIGISVVIADIGYQAISGVRCGFSMTPTLWCEDDEDPAEGAVAEEGGIGSAAQSTYVDPVAASAVPLEQPGRQRVIHAPLVTARRDSPPATYAEYAPRVVDPYDTASPSSFPRVSSTERAADNPAPRNRYGSEDTNPYAKYTAADAPLSAPASPTRYVDRYGRDVHGALPMGPNGYIDPRDGEFRHTYDRGDGVQQPYRRPIDAYNEARAWYGD